VTVRYCRSPRPHPPPDSRSPRLPSGVSLADRGRGLVRQSRSSQVSVWELSRWLTRPTSRVKLRTETPDRRLCDGLVESGETLAGNAVAISVEVRDVAVVRVVGVEPGLGIRVGLEV
jgi:hypothetical protein